MKTKTIWVLEYRKPGRKYGALDFENPPHDSLREARSEAEDWNDGFEKQGAKYYPVKFVRAGQP